MEDRRTILAVSGHTRQAQQPSRVLAVLFVLSFILFTCLCYGDTHRCHRE